MADCTSAMVTIPLPSQSPGLRTGGAVWDDVQLAVLPPLLPTQVQFHCLVPEFPVTVCGSP